MRRLERRALIALVLSLILFLGLTVFVYRFVRYGSKWATFYGNQSLYSGEMLANSTIKDRNDVLLFESKDGEIWYIDEYDMRRATLHAVGDTKGNISTSAMVAYRAKMIGYNIITGTYKSMGAGGDIKLTIDAEACTEAYRWLADYDAGCVGVYNYKTGEIMCMVSTPTFDPYEPPEIEEDDTSGIFLNRFMSSTLTPGSIFKTVTAAAAIERGYQDSFTYTCTGEREVNGEFIRCMEPHGEVDLTDALAKSCNCAFSLITEEIGAEAMSKYVEKLGLTKVYDMAGISNIAGSFSFPDDSPIDLGWAGVGQYQDDLNPCSMMIYMGAVANGGEAAIPKELKSFFLEDIIDLEKIDLEKLDLGQFNPGSGTVNLLDRDTAATLASMMKNNVISNYGSWNFDGMDVGGKTGTGEVDDKEPNATFAGFLDDPDHPYAFIVCVENAGSGQEVALPIANAVLQVLVNNN